MRRKAQAFLVLLAISAFTGPAAAHPHAYVDYFVEVRFDEQGRATALHEVWLFDEFYSAYVTAGAGTGKDGKPKQDKLDAVANENIKNLAEYDYFTRVTSGDEKVALGTATELSTGMRGQRLEMSFTVPFKQPVPANDLPLIYGIFDPTYYVEMLHAKDPEPIKLVGAPKSCAFEMEKPNPDPNVIIMAASLDKNQSAGDRLGAIFAEKVTIRCGK